MPSSPVSPRDYFPRGLIQPGGGYRFSADSLLLACFARIKPRARVADLGAGCGVAGFGLVLRAPGAGMRLTAIDVDADMLAATAENASLLELGEHFTVVAADVGAIGAGGPGATGATGATGRAIGPLTAGSFGLALANPPYREPGRGRASPKGEAANTARFDSGAGLAGFIRAGAYLLKNGGALCLVGPALRLAEMLALLEANSLAPKRLLSVHGRLDSPAKIVLLESIKNANPGLRIEAPLVLYEKGQGNRVTPGALAFCPYLGCNAG